MLNRFNEWGRRHPWQAAALTCLIPIRRPDGFRDRLWNTEDQSEVAVPFAQGEQVIGAIHAISRHVDAFSSRIGPVCSRSVRQSGWR